MTRAARVDRRSALLGLGAGALGALVGGRAGAAARATAPSIEALSRRLQRASEEEAFEVAARAIAAGADRTALLGAVFLAALRDIRPRPHGILHTVMMVESVFVLGDGAAARDAWLPALFALHDLKRAQARDRDEVGDWTMPPRPDVVTSSATAAGREFDAAMEDWDADRADRAVVALLPHVDRAEMFERLWPLAARCSSFIGHKMIYAAQVERTLRRIGWAHAETALRAAVRTLLWQRDTARYERSWARRDALPAGWSSVAGVDADASRRLWRALRASSPDDAREAVVAAFDAGHGLATVRDAYRLLAAEVFERRPGRRAVDGRGALLPVHAVTVVNAFGHALRTARRDATRRALVLQEAAMLTGMRDLLGELVGLSLGDAPFDALGDDLGEGALREASLDGAFEAGSPARARAALRRASPAEFLARADRALARGGIEHHQHKLAAAAREEASAAHPRWRSLLLAPAIDYLAHPDDAETDVHRRSVRALADAGVGD